MEAVPHEIIGVMPRGFRVVDTDADILVPLRLERSRLVKSKKRGRVRTYEIAPERFGVVEGWLTARRREWEARLDRFDQYVTQLKEKESAS